MEYENMRVLELKALTREHGLRGYSHLRKAELIDLLHPQGGPTPPRLQRPPSPPPPPPQPILHQYQLKFKRGGNRPFIEPPIAEEERVNEKVDPKKLMRMKKKFNELNRKI